MNIFRKRIFASLIFIFASFASMLAAAGVVVVTHPSSSVQSLTRDQISQLFLGRSNTLPDGKAVTLVDLAEGSELRVVFVTQVLGKSEQQLRSHWTRMIFSGKGQPPRSVGSSAEVARFVSTTPGAVGYIDSKDLVAGKIKVLYSVE